MGPRVRHDRSRRAAGRVTTTGVLVLAALALFVFWADPSGLPQVGSPPPAPAEWTEQELYGPCTIAKVVDGDTVDVLCSGSKTRVRLLRVDTPERDEPGFEAARDALQRMVGRRPLHLVFEEPGVPSWGNYGRMLAYLVNERGQNLNLEMVRQGWSPFYRKFGDGRFGKDFEKAEATARRQAKGLWGKTAPAAPAR